METAVYHVPGQDAHHRALIHEKLQGVKLVIETHALAQAFLKKSVQHGVARAVGRSAGAVDLALTEFAGVPPKGPLVDASVLQPRKRKPHVLKLDHHRRRLAAHELDGVLIAKPVRPLHRVEHVVFPRILFNVAQAGPDPSLGANRVAAGGEHLA